MPFEFVKFITLDPMHRKGPATRRPQQDFPYWYFDTTIWVYDSCDPEASSNLRLWGMV